jgi:hypothetical protein
MGFARGGGCLKLRRAHRSLQSRLDRALRTVAFRWTPKVAACCLVICSVVPAVRAQSVADCEQAGRAAEQQFGLPADLLLAIGDVESGRWDARLQRIAPWPWAVDVDGDGRLFNDSAAAVDAARAAQATGKHSIDVGCFQISLLYHPDAFTDLNQAFDPQANAQYAARLLVSLKVRLGNWAAAVAAYHSATPELGQPYRQRVFAAWSGADGSLAVPVKEFPGFPGIRVWSPSPFGTAARVIAIHSSTSPLMPRVITPGR